MEVAAGVVATEQVVSTAVEAGVVYGVAKPTPSLIATYNRISSEAFLPRLNHSLTVVNGQAYIFGGETEAGKLAGDEVHIISLPLKKAGNEGKPDYKCVPSLGEGQDGKIPGPRAGHTAVSVGSKIYVFGGRGEEDKPIEEVGRVWVFDTKTLGWSYLDPIEDPEASIPPSRYLHATVASDKPAPPPKAPETASVTESLTTTLSKLPSLVTGTTSIEEPSGPYGTLFVHAGFSAPNSPLSDSWIYNILTRTWTPLPSISSKSTITPSLALNNSILYNISGTSDFSHDIHTLHLTLSVLTEAHSPTALTYTAAQSEWTTTTIPTNPLTPGPRSRRGAALLPLSTGAGREYLVYIMGEATSTPDPPSNEQDKESAKKTQESTYYSDAWAYGLPPSGLTAAGLKDAARSTIGLSTTASTWAEVKVEANVEAGAEEGASGKSHPGPRAWFAGDAVGRDIDGGKGVVIWGGRNGRGEVEGDGWIVSIG